MHGSVRREAWASIGCVEEQVNPVTPAGNATVRLDASTMVTDFVCIPRPIERSPGEDGRPLRYHVRNEVPLWRAGERPQMRQTVVEGDAGLAV